MCLQFIEALATTAALRVYSDSRSPCSGSQYGLQRVSPSHPSQAGAGIETRAVLARIVAAVVAEAVHLQLVCWGISLKSWGRDCGSSRSFESFLGWGVRRDGGSH